MKKKLISLLIIALFAFGGVSYAKSAYEYMVINLGMSINAKKHAKKINEYALEGWRVVDVVGYQTSTFVYFEREIDQ